MVGDVQADLEKKIVTRDSYVEDWFGLYAGLEVKPFLDGIAIATFHPHHDGHITLANLSDHAPRTHRAAYLQWLSTVSRGAASILLLGPQTDRVRLQKEIPLLENIVQIVKTYDKRAYSYGLEIRKSGFCIIKRYTADTRLPQGTLKVSLAEHYK